MVHLFWFPVTCQHSIIDTNHVKQQLFCIVFHPLYTLEDSHFQYLPNNSHNVCSTKSSPWNIKDVDLWPLNLIYGLVNLTRLAYGTCVFVISVTRYGLVCKFSIYFHLWGNTKILDVKCCHKKYATSEILALQGSKACNRKKTLQKFLLTFKQIT